MRNGSPNPLHVKTESRKNHNLTLVTGLENFGIDPNALANMLKRKLGANTTVGEWKAKSGATKAEVAVSGLWEKSVRAATLCFRVTRPEFVICLAVERALSLLCLRYIGGGATGGRVRCRQAFH